MTHIRGQRPYEKKEENNAHTHTHVTFFSLFKSIGIE